MKTPDIQFALEQHDAKIESLGFNIWVGMEPTFTQRFSEIPEWLSEALGPQKLQYAYQLLQKIYSSRPGGIVLYTLGRQYAGENQPRWSIGYYRARNNQFSWEGPAGAPFDPHVCADIDIEHFWRALCDQISLQKTDQSWQAAAFKVNDELKYRIVFRCDGTTPVFELKQKPALARPSVHNGKIPLNGLTDDLAEEGELLLSLGLRKTGDSQNAVIYLELPSIKAVDIFIRLLLCIADAAKQASITCLVLQGFPPPVDSTIAWTTITPDPAVVEINQAPSENASSFFKESQLCYQAAEQIGLSSYRLNYTGAVSDSGGGGQFTIGGPTALDSPFIRWPLLLPRLIRYFNAHPALSYWFAPPSIGSSSQSPRLDEGVRESFQELMVALEQLEKAENPQPEFIWRSISPFTVDPSGNPHR
ncbi:MAG: transglutaminase family protein, partial [Gammaproteobacteria bacterium]